MFQFKCDRCDAVIFHTPEKRVKREIEIRVDPITGESSRITLSRMGERERGLECLSFPPDEDMSTGSCPFCSDNIEKMTPVLDRAKFSVDRMVYKASTLFPNLYPYTKWSAVSLIDENHYVEIGQASPESYRDCLINCSAYLKKVLKIDKEAGYMAITQNHLPSAGGSLIHPHIQIHATSRISNRHRLVMKKAKNHRMLHGTDLFGDFARVEREKKERYIGSTGTWHWMSAFAPRGFYEIWGINESEISLIRPEREQVWENLAAGIINVQRFYRSLNRNGYNLDIVSREGDEKSFNLRVCLVARAPYAPFVRSDITGFEMGFGEMATFTTPESTTLAARPFWTDK